VGARHAGDPQPTLRAFPLDSVPPAIAALSGRLERVVDEIRDHPRRVVLGRAAWRTPYVDAGAPLTAELALTNKGTLPLALANPLGAAPGAWNGLRLIVERAGAPPGDAQTVELTTAHVRGLPGAPGGPTATLDPGAGLELVVQKRVYLAPGRYHGWLSYADAIDDPGDPQFVGGELLLDLGLFQVDAPRT
jgi:hypothetical protein